MEEKLVEYQNLTGIVTLKDVRLLTYSHFATLGIRNTGFGVEEEYWEQVLGYRNPDCAVSGAPAIEMSKCFYVFSKPWRQTSLFFPTMCNAGHRKI